MKMAMAVHKTKLMEWFWRLHPKLYRATGGRLGSRIMGMPVLLLTTTGRKSGEPRTVALMYLPDGEGFVVIASYAGEDRHPAWWLNLRENPQATVETGGRRVAVEAREAEGEEREELWRRVVATNDSYATYQERTSRRIPVVVLKPVG